MTDPAWKYVVHAIGQSWIVDDFMERGKIPTGVEYVESPHCPRGKIFLLPDPDHYLNTLKADSISWGPEAQEFAETWHQREMDRLIQESIRKHMPTPQSFVKIASLT